MDPVERLRRNAQRTLRVWLTGADEPPPRARRPDGDDGLFGPDSVAWRVHADASMLVGGLRALLYQTTHPAAMAGVADHSDYRRDPLGRLQRTGAYIGVTTYAGTAEARRMVETVRAIHDRVEGTTPDGRPYRANDPHLPGWVHATEVDSFLRAYQRYGGAPLEPAEADRYVAEMAVVGELLGVVEAPTDRASLVETLGAYHDELAVGDQARDAVRFLLRPPFPPAARVPYAALAAAAVELLPTHVRRLLALAPLPAGEAVLVRPGAFALVRALAWTLAPPADAA